MFGLEEMLDMDKVWLYLSYFHFITIFSPAYVAVYWFLGWLGVVTRKRLVQNEKKREVYPLAKPLSELEGKPEFPCVSIITPIKFATTKAASPEMNFESQLAHEYRGHIENIYVFESEDDKGVAIIRRMQRKYQNRHDIRLVFAGLATTCSQKIHNMVAGIDACSKDSEYVYFLDNSTRCMRRTLQRLVEKLEESDDCIAASGYPLDIPATKNDVPGWCVATLRHGAMAFVNMRVNASYCWGGSMLLRRKDVERGSNNWGIRQLWLEGGVMDDMAVTAAAIENGKFIANIPQAIFYNDMRPNLSLPFACNFIIRQLSVCVWYCSPGTHARHLAILFAGMLPPTLLITSWNMCLFTVCSLVFDWEYTQQYPIARRYLLFTLLSFLSEACSRKFYITSFGQFFDTVAKMEASDMRFPYHRLEILWLVFTDFIYVYVTQFCGFCCLYKYFCRGTLFWASIKYDMEKGRCVGVRHPKQKKK